MVANKIRVSKQLVQIQMVVNCVSNINIKSSGGGVLFKWGGTIEMTTNCAPLSLHVVPSMPSLSLPTYLPTPPHLWLLKPTP